MNQHCPLCGAWLGSGPLPFKVGPVAFCDEEHALKFKLNNEYKATA